MKNKSLWRLHIENFPDGKKFFPCRVSIPVYNGIKNSSFSVIRPDGSVVRAQSRTIVQYPSGFPRWIQLDFEGNGNGLYKIINKACDNKNQNYLSIVKDKDGFTVQSKRLTLILNNKLSFPVSSIIWKGKRLICPDEKWCFTTDADGKIYDIRDGYVENFKVEACGENRFQISWESFQKNPQSSETLLKCRFRLEMLAGIEGFSLSYQFFHCLPGCAFIDVKSMVCDFIFPGFDEVLLLQEFYSNIGSERLVKTKEKVDIFLDRQRFKPYVVNKGAIGDFFNYPVFLQNLNDVVGETIGIRNSRVTVLCCMRDFIHQRPKSITVEPGRISFGLWPEFAEILHLQQGMSKRFVFDFTFFDSHESCLEETMKKQNYLEPLICLLDSEDTKIAGKTWHQSIFSPKELYKENIFSWLMSNATTRLHTVSEMFHYGDTPDYGYTRYYAGSGRFPAFGNEKNFYFNTSGGIYQNQFAVEPVWSNNEYDAIYCLALEMFRSKKLSVFQKLRAFARHQIEIDFVHYSDSWQQHRSTPQHSYCHTRTMASLPSHQWTQGLYHYYVLTGDDDVIDVIKGICDFNMAYFDRISFRFDNFFNREYGWAILSLVYGFEATANKDYIEKAKIMIRQMEKNTSRMDVRNAFGKGFAQNTVLIGLMTYHQATNETWAKKLFLKWLDQGMKNFTDKSLGPRVTELFIEPLTYGFYITGDKNYLKKSFWHFELFFKCWCDLGWLSGSDTLTTKTYARIYRGLVHFVCACAKAKVLKQLEKLVTMQ